MLIKPVWPAAAQVHAVMTTRQGGFSSGAFDSMNLGTHVEDDPAIVQKNRDHLRQTLNLPAEPLWLEQIHSTVVAHADSEHPELTADASVAHSKGSVCVVMTADCLPVLLTNREGTIVAAAHAGWRGLNDGVLENTIASMQCAASELMAWMGPAIGPQNFEVGQEVKDAFVANHEIAADAFEDGEESGKWFADIYQLARLRLTTAGVPADAIYGGGLCTYEDAERFFSYRRDGKTGRMASLIWIS